METSRPKWFGLTGRTHRSGETEDATIEDIADIAVATNCGQINTGLRRA